MINTYNSKTGINGERLNLVVNEELKKFYFHTCNVFNKGEVTNEMGIREVKRMAKELISDGYTEVKYAEAKNW